MGSDPAGGERPCSSPILLFDADCGFCTRSAGWLHRPLFRAAVDTIPFQHADLEALGLREEDCERLLHAVLPDGRITAGAGAVAAALKVSRAPWPLIGSLLLLPGARQLAEIAYHAVARNRHNLPGGTAACSLPSGS